jgi:hypothetical protein
MAETTLDQLSANIIALTGDKAKLAAGVTLQTDLVSASNAVATLIAERDAALGNVRALTGDKAKLAAGATLPTDLVSATNAIAVLTKERDDAKANVTKLEGEKKTVEQAVAAKLVELGITDRKTADEGKAGDAKLTKTQLCLKANNLPINEKVTIGYGAGAGTDGGASAD